MIIRLWCESEYRKEGWETAETHEGYRRLPKAFRKPLSSHCQRAVSVSVFPGVGRRESLLVSMFCLVLSGSSLQEALVGVRAEYAQHCSAMLTVPTLAEPRVTERMTYLLIPPLVASNP